VRAKEVLAIMATRQVCNGGCAGFEHLLGFFNPTRVNASCLLDCSCGREMSDTSSVAKRSVTIAGHKTSITLEDAFWSGLKEIANRRDISVSDLLAAIDSEREASNLSSAIRLFVLDCYRNQLLEQVKRDRTRGVLAKVLRGTGDPQ
jgi:predicted DNA-binding ribbon-helix-helix protein